MGSCSVRRVACVALAAATLAVAGAASAAGSSGGETAAVGPWRASLTYTRTGAGPAAYSALHLKLRRSGTVVLDTPVTSHLPGARYLQPGGFRGTRTLSLRDLDGDGIPELLLVLFTGGAHCCFIEQVYALGGRTPEKSEISFADAGAEIARVGGSVVFKSADESFAYVFTDYADSGAPLLLWAYSHGRFTNVTRSHPAALARDAAFWWRLYRGRLASHGDERGVLSAWAADEARLGRAARAKEQLLRLAASGILDRGDGAPKGIAYVRRLFVLLGHEGYLR